jgi:hypothetical protein
VLLRRAISMINIIDFLKEEKTESFQIGCGMPIGYVAGLPIISKKGDKVLLKVPFLKYKVTGVVDKTLVFPVKYVLTYSLPDMKPVGFEDLEYNSAFRKLEFDKPIGYFRHEAIKSWSKKTYKAKKEELMGLYDKLATALVENGAFSEEESFKALLKTVIEPSVMPIYKALDGKFYDKYLA